MTMLEIGRENRTLSPAIPLKIALNFKIGEADERTLELEVGQPIGSILVLIADERGCKVEELILLLDGENAPMLGGTVVGHDYPHHRRHHVHHVRDLEVVVFYQADSHRRVFKRFQTVEAVLDWAISVFGIDPTMAPEFELARHGHKEELPLSEHLGHLAKHHDCLELDLNRSELPNG